jgi:hypothetical protein
MAGSKISYNIHAQMVKDSNRLKQHLAKVQPSVALVMDGLGLAKEIKTMLPNTLVVHRNWGITQGDDDVHKRVSPEDWLNLRAKESEGGFYLNTTNEPGFNDECINWHIDLMQRAAKRGVRLVVGNFAVGTPGPDDWGQAKQMLQLLDQYRDLFVLGLHEYACGVITSGLYGGAPNNAGVQIGATGGKDLVPKDKWPQDVSGITLWHCGRFKFLMNYCQKNGIKPPRIILTEHGMDDVSDIKPWADKLTKSPPYLNIRGWKSLRTQWNQWFNPSGWSAERAYFEQLAWADRVIYGNSPVEGQCIFSWGHSSDQWEQFDIAEASEFQSLLETYAQQGASQATFAPTPIVTTPIAVPSFSAQAVTAAPTQSATAATPAATIQPVSPVTQPAASANGQNTITLTLSDDDFQVISKGLATFGKVLSDPAVATAFQRLADVFARAKK